MLGRAEQPRVPAHPAKTLAHEPRERFRSWQAGIRRTHAWGKQHQDMVRWANCPHDPQGRRVTAPGPDPLFPYTAGPTLRDRDRRQQEQYRTAWGAIDCAQRPAYWRNRGEPVSPTSDR